MFKNYKIYDNELNEARIINNSEDCVREIIAAYNNCTSPDQYNEFTSAVIGILENNFDYGY